MDLSTKYFRLIFSHGFLRFCMRGCFEHRVRIAANREEVRESRRILTTSTRLVTRQSHIHTLKLINVTHHCQYTPCDDVEHSDSVPADSATHQMHQIYKYNMIREIDRRNTHSVEGLVYTSCIPSPAGRGSSGSRCMVINGTMIQAVSFILPCPPPVS